MERYLRALDEYMQDVRRFQEGGSTNKNVIVSDDFIRQFSRNKPKKIIIEYMKKFGVSPEQYARATGTDIRTVKQAIQESGN